MEKNSKRKERSQKKRRGKFGWDVVQATQLIGKQIAQERKRRKIPQNAFAAQCNISEATLRRIEKGQIPVTFDVLCQMSQLLKVSLTTMCEMADKVLKLVEKNILRH